MNNTGRIVRTKILLPKRPHGLLHRPRLVEFLHQHIDRKLILISAAAGYGKTSFLLDFAYDTDLPVCWYALDQADRDPQVFLEHLAASIAAPFPQIQEGLLSALLGDRAGGGDPSAWLRTLINEIQGRIPDFFVILLDDYHYSDAAPEVSSLVEQFIEHQPGNCCLVLASRSLPRLPMLRLAARQEIAGLGNRDLAFSAEEIRDLLAQNFNLRLPLEEAARLASESEGWITGILLSTHTLWKGLLQTFLQAKGKHENLFSYLAQEAFDLQTEGVRRFLKSTSILSIMDVQLCNELLEIDDAQAILDHLEERNLFITRVENAYRYHQLFREFLLSRFALSERALRLSFHLKAARLLEKRCDLENAIDQFLEPGEHEQAARLIERLAKPTFDSGRLQILAEWIDALPAESLHDRPALQLYRGRIFLEKGDLENAQRHFHQAYLTAQRMGDVAEMARALIQEAHLDEFGGRYREAMGKAERVLTLVQGGALSPISVAEAHRILGICHHHTGDLVRAESELLRALESYQQQSDLFNVANTAQDLGGVARRRGRLTDGDTYYQQALRIWKKLNNRSRLAELLNNIGVGHYYRGEYSEATRVLEEALAEARYTGNLRSEAFILASQGDVYCDLGEVSNALDIYQQGLEIAKKAGGQFIIFYLHIALGSAYRLLGDLAQAHSWLSEAKRLAEEQGADYGLGLVQTAVGILAYEQGRYPASIKALDSACTLLRQADALREAARAYLHRAQALYLSGRTEESEASLEEALNLATQTGYEQFLVVDGQRMLSLLQHGLERGLNPDKIEAVLQRTHQFSKEARRIIPVVVEEAIPKIEIRALGPTTVILDGSPISPSAWGGPLVRELFFLILERGPVSREQVGAILWPEYSRARVHSAFHSALYRLRRIVPASLIIYDPEADSYSFDRQREYWYDVERFEEALRRAKRAPDIQRAGQRFREAIDLHRGEFLADSILTWPEQRRQQLRRSYVEALVSLAQLQQRSQDYAESLQLYRRALQVEPYREDVLRLLLGCLMEAGQRSEAIREYQAFAQLLQQEMGTEPMEETKRFFEELRRSGRLRGSFSKS